MGIWGLGIGDWGLGIGPIPNPQSPIPNPQSPIPMYIIIKNILKYFLLLNAKIAIKNNIIFNYF